MRIETNIIKEKYIALSITILLSFILLLTSCNNTKNNQITSKHKEIKLSYATHFKILDFGNYHELVVKNPWVDASNIEYKYAITTDSSFNPTDGAKRILLPIKRIAAISTTHIAFIDKLGKLSLLKAFSDKEYVYSKNFYYFDSISPIVNIGFENNLNIEKLISANVQVIFLYGVGNEVKQVEQKILRAGIVPIFIGEYTEAHPLAKAEWIKFFGEILGEPKLSDSIFNAISSNYKKLNKLVENVKTKPSVLVSFPWNDVWNIPGGKTTTAKLIADAGGNYIFKHDTKSINIPYDIEAVFHKAQWADYWINTGTAQSLNEIGKQDVRLKLFKAFKNKTIFNNNKRRTPTGGSDYMESAVINPDLVLRDLIKIFHPKMLQELSFTYYNKLQ